MKTKLMITWITVSLFIGINGIHAQPEAGQLDQTALMQQFVGTWENEYKPDTFILWKIQPYGKGWKATYEIATTGKVLREAKQLIGIDPDSGNITNWPFWCKTRYI